jgi:hypothetical protein
VALSNKLEVLGFARIEFELTSEAIDLALDAALPGVVALGLK